MGLVVLFDSLMTGIDIDTRATGNTTEPLVLLCSDLCLVLPLEAQQRASLAWLLEVHLGARLGALGVRMLHLKGAKPYFQTVL